MQQLMQQQKEYAQIAKDLRQLIDTANAPIFGIDSRGCVNEWNNKVRRRELIETVVASADCTPW